MRRGLQEAFLHDLRQVVVDEVYEPQAMTWVIVTAWLGRQ